MGNKTMAMMTIEIDDAVNELLKDAAERAHRSKIKHVSWLLEQEANAEYARQQSDDARTGAK